MYTDFYGLKARPFQLTPDPHYYFESGTHKKAMAYLGYGLAQGEGFIVVTGEIGAGKTMLTEHLLKELDPARVLAARIVSTNIAEDDVLRLVANSFGLVSAHLSKAQLLEQIEHFLQARYREGRKVLLIVDEVQGLPHGSLEELRMLSNFQSGNRALVQIFLLGQPEFRTRLASAELEQLRQRVIATHHLDPMTEAEVAPYLRHRLQIAGWNGRPEFGDDAFAALHAASGGIPRRINALTERLLVLGALDKLEHFSADTVEAVASDHARDETRGAHPVVTAGGSVPGADGHIVQDLAERASALEARLTEQDAALRKILTLLIDWVEREEQASTPHQARAPVG